VAVVDCVTIVSGPSRFRLPARTFIGL